MTDREIALQKAMDRLCLFLALESERIPGSDMLTQVPLILALGVASVFAKRELKASPADAIEIIESWLVEVGLIAVPRS